MSKLLLFGFGNSLWEYITVLFDNIPKIMYLIYASVASCLDVLQCVMKKLAGLDTYWINGNAVVQQDPVLEFIYGIIGIGPNKGSYYAINTVFWSLVIFAAIVLLVSTMIAIIKSHYGEDSNKTNPITYVFTAVKAIFTFMITPVAVILGVYLSQFLLQTLDNITAGSVTEDTLKGIYGSNATSIFKGEALGDGGGTVYYGRYDFFSLGSATSSTTFSGMMFRAAAYDANRARLNDDDSAQGLSPAFFQGSGLLSGAFDNNRPSARPSGDDMSDNDWLAYQVDFAFMNNLQLQNWTHVNDLYNRWDDYGGKVVMSIASVDFFSAVGFVKSFSKYNVGLVWYFYRLWKFNFFVGFASIIVSLGILVSIIIGLMSRLIQSAAMFMIFPPLLGLAPLDDFNAFKKWRQKFMSYILMAFGAIIGMNLFFLVMPYVNEIQWFGTGALWGVINSIINTLIIIVGLISVKTFIAFCSELIGAADALATGEGMKKELGSTLAKTGKMVGGAANFAFKATTLPMRGIGKDLQAVKAAKDVKKMDADIASAKSGLPDDNTRQTRMDSAAEMMNNARAAHSSDAGYIDTVNKTRARAQAMGIDLTSDEYKRMEYEATDKYLEDNSADYKHGKAMMQNEGYTDTELKNKETLGKLQTARQEKISKNMLNADGKVDKSTLGQVGKKVMGDVMGALLKGIQEGSQQLSIDPGKIKDVFASFTNLKLDDKGKVVGSYNSEVDNAEYRRHKAAVKAGEEDNKFVAGVKGIWNAAGLGSAAGAPPPQKPATSDDKLVTAAKQIEKSADAMLKAAEKLSRFKP